jgi:hypothetical protein
MSKEGGGVLVSRFPSKFYSKDLFWEQILHFARLIVTAVRDLK